MVVLEHYGHCVRFSIRSGHFWLSENLSVSGAILVAASCSDAQFPRSRGSKTYWIYSNAAATVSGFEEPGTHYLVGKSTSPHRG